MTKKKNYDAVLTYKTKDEVESRIMNERYAKIVLDVYMSPEEFAKLVVDLTGKAFKISFK